MKVDLAFFSCLILVASTVHADDAQSLVLSRGIAVPVIQKQGFAGVHIDPVEAQIVTGTYQSPKAGHEIEKGNAASAWRVLEADKDGWFTDPIMTAGGMYVHVDVPSERDEVRLLDATGHAMVYVNGEPRVGDIYSNGQTLLPVRLRKGDNQFLFIASNRTGRMRATLSQPKANLFFNSRDVTSPDLLVGEPVDHWASMIVVNAADEWVHDARITIEGPDGIRGDQDLPALPPLSFRKVGFRFKGPAPSKGGEAPLKLALHRSAKPVEGGDAVRPLDESLLRLGIRQPSELHRRTFVSRIDGSVQYFAVRLAAPQAKEPAEKEPKGEKLLPPPKAQKPEPSEPTAKPGILLALHGAAVEAVGHAACYEPQTWTHIVAPTNRRPFGFDWESFGRLDAIEVLELAQKQFDHDPRAIRLSGHSMGGHGTWQIGATYPGRFAALGPSAGWMALYSHEEAMKGPQITPMHELLARPRLTSDTVALSRNFAGLGIYILHGEKDDNVPVEQSREMNTLLGTFHKDFTYHEQPGAGHWWGNQCVSWPAMMEFLKKREIPTDSQVKSVAFVTANPGVSAWRHWVCIEQQVTQSLLSSVEITCDAETRTFTGKTRNVAHLCLKLDHLNDGPVTLELDGQKLSNRPRPEGDRLWLRLVNGKWSVTPSLSAAEKGPHRHGPFLHAFNNRFLFVVSTAGTHEENAWSLAKARFDAERLWYQGNASVDIVTDTQFDSKLEPDRSVIVYGNAATNSAWRELLAGSPIQPSRYEVWVNADDPRHRRHLESRSLACVFAVPRPGSDTAMVAAIGGTSVQGMRLTDRFIAFHSRAGYPDWMIVSTKMLMPDGGTTAVRGAGYFGNDWGVQRGESLWQDAGGEEKKTP